MNRSINSINVMARRMKLGSFLDSGDYLTFHQLLCALGYENSGYSYFMISWVRNRDFPIHTKKVNNNSFKIVYIEEFWNWAEKNKELLDFSQFEENILGAEPEWVKLKRKHDKEKKCKYKTTPWTKTEDIELKRLVSLHQYGYDEISRRMNRTCGAIQRRLCDLNIKDRPVKADNHTGWLQDELEQLGTMIKQGYEYEMISEKLKRSSKAIRGLVYRYYITENLDKVRQYIGEGYFGDNCPEKHLKHFKIMNTEERNQVRYLISRLAGILDADFHRQLELTEWGKYYQKDMCQNFCQQCLDESIGCDECIRYQKIEPQNCKMCGHTFFKKKQNLYCIRCRNQRKYSYLKKKQKSKAIMKKTVS